MSVHAVAGYAAVHFGKAHVDRGLLIKVFASYTLLNALVNLITRRGFGEKVRCCKMQACIEVSWTPVPHSKALGLTESCCQQSTDVLC